MIVNWRGYKKMSAGQRQKCSVLRCEIFLIKERLWKYHPSIIIGLKQTVILKFIKLPQLSRNNAKTYLKNLPLNVSSTRNEQLIELIFQGVGIPVLLSWNCLKWTPFCNIPSSVACLTSYNYTPTLSFLILHIFKLKVGADKTVSTKYQFDSTQPSLGRDAVKLLSFIRKPILSTALCLLSWQGLSLNNDPAPKYKLLCKRLLLPKSADEKTENVFEYLMISTVCKFKALVFVLATREVLK